VTNALIERISRLIHDTWRERYDARAAALGARGRSASWEGIAELLRDDYRACARAALKALGR